MMEWDSILRWGHRIANLTLFRLAGNEITIVELATAIGIGFLTLYVARLGENATQGALRARGVRSETTLVPAQKIVRYSLMSLGFVIAFHAVGIDLAALFTAGAIFAVGLGFAMQSIAQNFVSGVILLLERAIKAGDVVEVDGRFVRIVEMGIRSTIAKTRDEEEVIIPNHTLAQSSVKNFTYRDSLYRLRVPVGVAYSSDMAKVVEVLETVGREMKWRVTNKEPLVLWRDFGDSSMIFELSVWMQDPWTARLAESDIRRSIWNGLQAAGIVIAFPQMDVHFHSDSSQPDEAGISIQ